MWSNKKPQTSEYNTIINGLIEGYFLAEKKITAMSNSVNRKRQNLKL